MSDWRRNVHEKGAEFIGPFENGGLYLLFDRGRVRVIHKWGEKGRTREFSIADFYGPDAWGVAHEYAQFKIQQGKSKAPKRPYTGPKVCKRCRNLPPTSEACFCWGCQQDVLEEIRAKRGDFDED